MIIKNTGRIAPLDAAYSKKAVAKGETQATWVCDYVWNIYGRAFFENIVKNKSNDLECGNFLNSIGFKAIPLQLIKDKLEGPGEPLGEKYANWCDGVTGFKSQCRKNDIVANGWNLLRGQAHPKLHEIMYLVDGRAMHKDVYVREGNWDKYR